MKLNSDSRFLKGFVISLIGVILLYLSLNYIKFNVCENILWIIPNIFCFLSLSFIVSAGLFVAGVFFSLLFVLTGILYVIFGWSKIKKFIVVAGVLVAVIIYTISPIDIIPDILPIIGWVDDVLVDLIGFYMLYQAITEKDVKKIMRFLPKK